MSRPPVRERKPRIRNHLRDGPPARSLPNSKSSDSEPSGSRKYVKKYPINRDSIETLGRNCCLSDNGYEADTDDVYEEGNHVAVPTNLKVQRLPRSPNSFALPEPLPSHRFGSFLRVLGKSLHHCSLRIAAGFGLSRQQSAWYKNCWQSPGSQPKGIHLARQVTVPSRLSKIQAKSGNVESSTTL
ncbi:uncharacterized protein LOC121529859 [Drosophila eugracilis]|uniref:uncharacterized protein LOC121529859 n=1 Tax=Drosophila eugracilis TaxID=29029 RepID=UPI001BDB142C|nr:uncharacterized protein LOC121529859 [Drosophila eugracilis]